MNLTPEERKRLARAARRLAMACVNNGPRLTDQWPSCAIGESLRMAKIQHTAARITDRAHTSSELEGWFSSLRQGYRSQGILSVATRMRYRGEESTAVVFPLLAFADELEAFSDEAPQAPEETPE